MLTEKELLVLTAIKNNPHLSAAKLAKELNISKATVERVLQSLKGKSVLVREGSKKNGKWIIL